MASTHPNGSENEQAEAAADALAREAGLFPPTDPMSLGAELTRMGLAAVAKPLAMLDAGTRFTADLAEAASATAARALGCRPEPSLAPEPKDTRFSDRAWDDNPWFFAQRQAYLAWSRLMRRLAESAGDGRADADRTSFTVGFVVDALAPTNFLATNPAALRKAVQTRGASVLRGMANFVDDVRTNGGWPRQVDTSAFELGRSLAATPGKVVFRNDLMELIQYAPQTETVHATPLLLSPPWINKYYIMDLAPKRSFVEWAVQRGHTTFAISYRNPDATMRDVDLDDYLIHGPRQAIDVISDITGTEQVNMVGLCVGGTLTVMLLAYLAATGDHRVRSATLLNTLVDFSEPGPLGTFTDPASIRRLERKMAARGYLEASEMGTIFNSLRANDLIWNYVGRNWLMGESPPAFDILAWNGDGTRMPAAMHSFYLRSCYEENQLARDAMTLAGTPLHLGDITSETYIVDAREDHIVPWKSSYATTQLLGGPVRHVLTSSGHIAGIVNPPSPKRSYWTNDDLPADPDAWLAGATLHQGSWWEDWAPWMEARAGDRQAPPPMGSKAHPAVADAPGSYVHG